MSGKYALIIGNTEYTDPGLAQLTAPGKDAEDFARVLKDQDIGAFDYVNILLNQLSSTVSEAIDEFFDLKKPDDLLVLYFSGHGVRDELGALYLAVKNTIRSRLRSTAIKSDYIREAMDQSRSKRQVLILDCCNSGAFPQGTKAELGGAMGMTKAFQGYGRFVLTASDATQFAWEGDKVIGKTANSLFTHFLVKGLEGEADNNSDGKITVDELYDYAYEQISRVTPKQTPTKSASKQEGEIILRQNMRIEDIKPAPLPAPLLDSIENPLPDIRLGAVQQLTKLLNGKNLGLARSAREALERISQEDDSRQVSKAAIHALESIRQAEQLALQKTEEEGLATVKLESEKLAKEKRPGNKMAKADQISEKHIKNAKVAPANAQAKHTARQDVKRKEVERLHAQQDAVKKMPVNVSKNTKPSWASFIIIGGVIIALVLCGFAVLLRINGGLGPAATAAPVADAVVTEVPAFPTTITSQLPALLTQQREWVGSPFLVYSSDRENPTPTGEYNPQYSAIYLSLSGSTTSPNDKRISELGGNSTPAWSPDGEKIAYINWSEQINITNQQGQLIREIKGDFFPISDSVDTGLNWSSDGKMLSFLNSKNLTVVVLDVESETIRIVANKEGEGVALSPDNQKIAFMTREGNDVNDHDGWVIYIVNIDGTNLTRVTNTTDFRADHGPFLWTPDGKYLTYVSFSLDSQGNTGDYEVWIVQSNGKNPQPLSTTIEVIDQRYYPWFRLRSPSDIWDTH